MDLELAVKLKKYHIDELMKMLSILIDLFTVTDGLDIILPPKTISNEDFFQKADWSFIH